MDLPDVHLAEGRDSKRAATTPSSKDAFKWAGKSQHRATAAIFGDLQTDERVLVPSAKNWDAEGWIAGLPVTAGVGRLVNLRTGRVRCWTPGPGGSRSRWARRTRTGRAGAFKHLWDVGLPTGGRGAGSSSTSPTWNARWDRTPSGCCNVPPGRRCTGDAVWTATPTRSSC